MKTSIHQTLVFLILLKAFATVWWIMFLVDSAATYTVPTTSMEYTTAWETTQNISVTNSTTTSTLSQGYTTQTSSDTSVSTTTTSRSFRSTISNSSIKLACYDCSESFQFEWTPYTNCQAYPKTVSLRECLNEEKYCMVERTSYRERTISISRGCTDKCWYGCHPSDFGLTKLKCISCCQTRACNTDSSGHGQAPNLSIQIIIILFGFISM